LNQLIKKIDLNSKEIKENILESSKDFNYELYNTFELLVMSLTNSTFIDKILTLKTTFFTLLDTFLSKVMENTTAGLFRLDLLAKSMLCVTVLQ